MAAELEQDRWNRAPQLASDGWWHIGDYHDIKRALRDPRFSAALSWGPLGSPKGALREGLSDAFLPGRNSVKRLRGHWLAFTDPPEHTRLRAVLQPLWTARLTKLRPQLEQRVKQLFDQVAQAQTIHAYRDLTLPLPTRSISEILGLPDDAHAHFEQWFREQHTLFAFHDHPTREGFAASRDAIAYYSNVVQAHRAKPQDDLISDLIDAQAQGAPFSDADLVATVLLLSVSGFRTLERFFMNTVFEYTRNPQAFRALDAGPRRVPLAVEEILRRSQHVAFVYRQAATDISMGDTVIPRDAPVRLDIDAASQDPTVFHNPQELDLLRRVNPHLMFGFGTHFCIGAPLARLEAQAFVRELIQRAPAFQPADQKSHNALMERTLPYDLRLRV